jgi:hypothetical protein
MRKSPGTLYLSTDIGIIRQIETENDDQPASNGGKPIHRPIYDATRSSQEKKL